MPVFNCEDTINQTLETILNQTYKDFMLYVVNNNSTKKTIDIIKSKNDRRIKIFNFFKKQQCSAALNFGLTKIKEDVIIRVDGDDLYDKDFVARLIKTYKNNNFKIIYGSYIFKYIDEQREELIKAISDRDLLLWRMLFFCTIDHNVLYEKKFINSLKNYNEIDYGEDYDLWTRSLLKDEYSIGSMDPEYVGCVCLKHPTCMTYRLKHIDNPSKISQNFIKEFLGIKVPLSIIKKVRAQPRENRSYYYNSKDKVILNNILSRYLIKLNIEQKKFIYNKSFFQFYV